MQRQAMATLIRWQKANVHLPLLVRGARQVGKTYLIEQFGKAYFTNMIQINFELEPHYIQCFDSLEPEEILRQVAGLKRQKITPGETLVFFDEIQECPRAIMALRYFKEKMPALHVIGAGSLLEFALREENFNMPVGRVQYFYVRPLSFREYLQSLEEIQLLEYIDKTTIRDAIPIAIHERLLYLVREYMVVGGMPAAIESYLGHKDMQSCRDMQQLILSTYRSDFGKYASQAQHKYLYKVFSKMPSIITKKVRYVEIDPDTRSRDLKRAIEDLILAGVIYPVYATNGSGLPLHTLVDERKFKLLFLDVGLVWRANFFDVSMLLDGDLSNKDLLDAGSMAEQFVGQEIMAYQNPLEENQLYYWERDAKNSQAEIDYLMSVGSRIVPIEVKSGTTGRMKSLQMFMEEKSCLWGVKICAQPLAVNKNVITIPFYLVSEVQRFIRELYG